MLKKAKIGFTWTIVVTMAILKSKFQIAYPRTRSQAPFFRPNASSRTPEKSLLVRSQGCWGQKSYFSAFSGLRGQGHAQNTDLEKYLAIVYFQIIQKHPVHISYKSDLRGAFGTHLKTLRAFHSVHSSIPFLTF